MITGVEYNTEKRGGEEGVVVIFTYDTKIPGTEYPVADAYEVFGESDYPIAMNILQMSVNAEHLMINLRNLLKISVH